MPKGGEACWGVLYNAGKSSAQRTIGYNLPTSKLRCQAGGGLAQVREWRAGTLEDIVIWQLAVLFVTAVIGMSLSGVAGFGGGVVVLPVLVWLYGPEVAVPVVAIFQLLGTFARVWLNRQFINWRVVAWFAAGSTPFAILGSFLFIAADTTLLVRIMGGAMIVLVALMQLPWSKNVRMTLWGFLPLGGVSGFLASVIGIPGPFQPVFYIAYGLNPREYMATFSLSMLVMQVPKLAVYSTADLLTPLVAGMGLSLGLLAIGGAYFGARLMRRVPEKWFAVGINAFVAAFGVLFMVTGG